MASRSPRRRVTSLGAAEHPLQLLERRGRHEHALALGQERRAGQVADRQAVRVGGDQAQALGLGGHEHAGEDRAGLVGAGRGARPGAAPRRGPCRRGSRRRRRARRCGGTRRRGWCAPRTASGPTEMVASSPSISTLTAPGSSTRTMSVASLAGRTATPSVIPSTVTVAVMVRSRSLPVAASVSPMSSRRTPLSTGSELPRDDTARPAELRASTRTSRSHRNFTAGARFLSSSRRG